MSKLINKRYQILEKIKVGGMSDIFLAADTLHENRQIIAKVLRNQSISRRVEDVIRFRNEVEVASKLHHTGIVKIFETGESDDHYYLISELIQGQNLKEILQQGKTFTLEETLLVITQICEILAYTHNRGLFHKDLKPSNIILTYSAKTGTVKQVKVIDFGISQIKELSEMEDMEQIRNTFSYMSPEQCGIIKRVVDERSDLYSLGVIFFQLLTNQLPFEGENISSILHKQIAMIPQFPPETKSQIPATIQNFVLKLLAKDMESRYQSAQGLLSDLERFRQGEIDFPLGKGDTSIKLNFRTSLIGRESEYSQLLKLLVQAIRGSGRLQFIQGEAGLGKTRIVDEIKSYCFSEKITFIQGKCQPGDNKIPFGAILDALKVYLNIFKGYSRDIQNTIQEKLKTTTRELGGMIITILPELKELIGDTPDIIHLDPEKDYKRLLMVFSRFLLNLAAVEKTLVLFLDDIHWIDDSSIELLSELIFDIQENPLFILGTFRESEKDRNIKLSGFIRNQSLTSEIFGITQLEIFDNDTMAVFLSNILHCTKADISDFSSFVHNRSKGNPFFALEVTKQLIHEQVIRLQPQGWYFDQEKSRHTEISSTIVEILLKRIRLLEKSELSILSHAAVLGRKFDIDVLFQSIDQDKESIVGLIDKAIDLQFLEIDTKEKGHFIFVHDRIREAFYENLDEITRKDLHEKTARILESKYSTEKNETIYALVHHYQQAEIYDKTITYAYLAGKNSLENYGYKEALTYFTTCKNIIERQGRKDQDIWVDTILALSGILLILGQNEEVIELSTGILSFIRTDMEKARLFKMISEAYFKKGDWKNCEDNSRIGLSFLNEKLHTGKPDIIRVIVIELIIHTIYSFLPAFLVRKKHNNQERYQLIIRFFYNLGWAYLLSDSLKFIRNVLKMMNLSERFLPDSRELGLAMGSFGSLLMAVPFFNWSIRIHKRSLKIKYKIKDEWGIAQSYQFLGFCYQWKGDFITSNEYFLKSREIFEKIGDIWEISMINNGFSANFFYISDYDQSINYSRNWLDISNKIKDSFGIGTSYCNLCFAYTEKGELDKAKDYGIQGLSLGQQNKDWLVVCLASLYLGKAFLEEGNIPQAKKHLEYAKTIYDKNSLLQQYTVIIYPYLAELYILMYQQLLDKGTEPRNQQELKELFPLALQYCKLAVSKTRHWVSHYGTALRIMAQMYSLIHRRGAADKFFKKSILHNRKIKRFYELGKSCLAYGEFLMQSNQMKSAHANISNAMKIFNSIGSETHMEKIKILLEKFVVSPLNDAEFKAEFSNTLCITGENISSGAERLIDKQRLASIIQTNQKISSILNLNELQQVVLAKAIEVTGASQGILFIWNGTTSKLELRERSEIPGSEKTAYPEQIVNMVFQSGKSLLLTNAAAENIIREYPGLVDLKLKSILCVPVRLKESIIGVCYLDNPHSEGVFSEEDSNLLDVFLSQVAISIENARLVADLENQVQQRTSELEKAKTEVEQKEKMKTAFFINLAHETKTPLTLIKNYLEEYMSTHKPDKRQAIIKKNVDKLIRDMLHFLEAEKIEQGYESYDHSQIIQFSTTVRNKLAVFQELAWKSNRITIEKSIEKDLHIQADPLAMDRVLNNLLDNAIKYSDKEFSHIYVELKSMGENVQLKVSDQGMGIPEDVYNHIFQPYYQLSRNNKNIHGVGMGLYITQQIIQTLQGSISVSSKLREGTVFTIILPRYRTQPGDQVTINEMAQAHISSPVVYAVDTVAEQKDRPAVLIIEDNQDMLHYLKELLEKKYYVSLSVNGKDALKKLEEMNRMPDIIVSDVMMDEMDGFEFLERIKKEDRYNKIPLIFLTALTSEQSRIQGIEAGAVDFIPKPFNASELLARIASLILLRQGWRDITGKGEFTSRIDEKCKEFSLTERETEVTRLILSGQNYEEIGKKLFISGETVKSHVKNIYRKTEVINKTGLISKLMY